MLMLLNEELIWMFNILKNTKEVLHNASFRRISRLRWEETFLASDSFDPLGKVLFAFNHFLEKVNLSLVQQNKQKLLATFG